MNVAIKIVLSLVLLICGLAPFFEPSNETGTLDSIVTLGIFGSIGLFLVFFTAIWFYCQSLQRCLSNISASNRKATPKSVWYMFLIPYNFIEDFFIVINISNSIEAEAKNNPKLSSINHFGLTTGLGWCIAQILSLIPNFGGQLAGLIGLILWLIHWRFIIKINQLLKST